MDETNNTPDVIDRNILLENKFSYNLLRPTEFIVIDFNILPTGLLQHNEKIKLYIYNSNRRIKKLEVLELTKCFIPTSNRR